MVKVLIGDLFESDAQTWVNTVNCVGVMGKGIALAFKQQFPEMYADYVRRCDAGEVQLGKPYLYRRTVPPWILNFPTKDHWRSVSKLSDIVAGLRYLEAHYQEWGITSLAVPPLGCGHGQLDWRIVGPTLYRHLQRLEIPVELYAPFGTPQQQLESTFLSKVTQEVAVEQLLQFQSSSHIDPAWLVLVEILARIEREPYHWPVGRIRFQKLVYFATEAGLPTGLTFQKGSYGPFASQLKQQTTRLVNHRLIVEEQLGKMFAIRVGPAYEDARPLALDSIQKWEPMIDKVVDLFLRTDTKQSEIAAAVHFAAHYLVDEPAPSEMNVYEAVLEWKIRRRPPLNPDEVATTVRNLNMLSWLNAKFNTQLPLPSESFV